MHWKNNKNKQKKKKNITKRTTKNFLVKIKRSGRQRTKIYFKRVCFAILQFKAALHPNWKLHYKFGDFVHRFIRLFFSLLDLSTTVLPWISPTHPSINLSVYFLSQLHSGLQGCWSQSQLSLSVQGQGYSGHASSLLQGHIKRQTPTINSLI